ncbi:MAG: uracil-DNA glycosylase [Thiovulaceae bacterium]|nr:uracil-DNA glycosylase [Sulfurimonadaceae bacterium]
MQKVNCISCIYYYVTWEAKQPHGCKAYGFKSKMRPSIAVKRSSGVECQLYITKKPST